MAVRHGDRETCQGQTQVHTVSHDLHLSLHHRQPQYFLPLHSIILYCRQFDWQNILFMNMHEAGETNLLPMKLHVTIKCPSITMTSYCDTNETASLIIHDNEIFLFKWPMIHNAA